MPFNIFAMPPSSIFLLFSIVFSGSNALPWREAQQTHAYKADAWSPRPTFIPEPADPARLFRRDALDVAICGWLGGNSASAATCSPGSSCIRDTIHGVVGCCGTSGPCTAGVYTSCIDMNSNGWTPNAGLDQANGVFTCTGTAVCYKNTFPGGYYQYGCGESSWATTVETTYSGQPSDLLLQQVFTGVVFTPTTASSTTTSSSSISSSTTSSSSSSSSSSTSTSSSSSSSKSASSTLPTVSKVPTQTGTSTPSSTAPAIKKKNNTGVIVGSVIGGLAGLAIIGAALFWFLRKKQARDSRAGPFESVHTNGQGPTSGPFQRLAPYQPYGPEDFGHTTEITGAPGPVPYSYADAPGPQTPPANHHQFYNTPPHEEQPLVSEIEDFSQSYHRAIGATVPTERDTHIHTGDLPDTVTGIGMGVGVSPMRRSPTTGNGRTQDRELTSESLRSPVGATVPVETASWLRSSPSTSRSGTGNGSNSSIVNNGSGTEMTVPPRSPLRDGVAGMGASLGSAVSAVVGRDNAPRYQLVDEARDDVPVLSQPGQLRQARMSRNVGWEDKGEV